MMMNSKHVEMIVCRSIPSLIFRFIIPELPYGKRLVFNLTSTWGDRHYIGLNGIEFFSDQGHPVIVDKVE
jgi:hypothetical protein